MTITDALAALIWGVVSFALVSTLIKALTSPKSEAFEIYLGWVMVIVISGAILWGLDVSAKSYCGKGYGYYCGD